MDYFFLQILQKVYRFDIILFILIKVLLGRKYEAQ